MHTLEKNYISYHDDLTDLDYSKAYAVTNKGRAGSVRGAANRVLPAHVVCACVHFTHSRMVILHYTLLQREVILPVWNVSFPLLVLM